MVHKPIFPTSVCLMGILAASALGQEGLPVDSSVVQDTPETVPVPQDRAEVDRQLRDELAATFDRIPGLDQIEVRVEAGVVFLRGDALTSAESALADSLARRMPGVLYVDNRISEATPVRRRLGPVVEELQTKLLTWVAYLPLIVVAGILVIFALLLARGTYRLEKPFARVTRNPFLRNLLRQVAAGGVALLGILVALELLDATALVGAVLGAAGVVGIAFGFAFRNIAENYLAGIILSLRQPFSPDDHILVEGQEGKVIRLTSRETVLMTLDGNHLRIPNATIFNSVMQNNTRNPLRRFRFDLSVSQQEDLARAREIGLSALQNMDGVLEEPSPRAVITEIGDSWVVIRFFGWVNQGEVAFDKARSEAIRLTKEALDFHGVAMPAPEYGIRVLEGVAVAGVSEAPVEVGEPSARSATSDPGVERTPSVEPDLTPDQSLDQQIAKDREEAKEPDLLGPST